MNTVGTHILRRSARNPRNAKALYVSFRLHEAFPRNDPLSVPLLRLMAATNDARFLVRLITIVHDRVEQANDAERLLRAVEFGYLVRMLCGHLHEAGKAIRYIWTTRQARGTLQRILRSAEDAGESFEMARSSLMDYSTGSIVYVLEHIRNHAAFHYIHKDFEEAYRNHPEEAHVLIATEQSGFSRYLVTDGFAAMTVEQAVGKGYDEYTHEVGRVLELAGLLGTAVDQMLVGFFKERPSAILKREAVRVSIPEAIRREREYAEAMREAVAPSGEEAEPSEP